jgi:hypothetical protein
MSETAARSLENAVVIRDRTVAEAYYCEWVQIEALSELLDWEVDWSAPEWEYGQS